MQKGRSKLITLEEADPIIINPLLKACYTCDYDDSMDDAYYRMRFNTRIYVAADMYMISFLKDLAKTKLTLQLARLKGSTVDVSRLVGVIRMIYGITSDQTFRRLLFPVLRLLRHDLRENSEFMVLFMSGLADGTFAADVFDALADLSDQKFFYCTRCDPADSIWFRCRECDGFVGCQLDPPFGE